MNHYLFDFSYASAKRCSNEDRTLMQLDFQQLFQKIRTPLPHKEIVENYIKASYLPEQSVDQWIRENIVNKKNRINIFIFYYID
ncbi:unnamed protein product [Adineta steineri]|uniref:Syndetin C-terminal domain-containing protein n=1 Tax=Adineta steineri TaxID=433720 RepID=A0A815IX80_9BILA|nr:unnamed protein product [Adineta steineri]CAF3766410.1 unnamed protein product [Adineta steineri]